MEDQARNEQQHPSLCRMGCGFFGNPAFEGLCSKCYRDYQERKDERQRQQQLPPSSSTSLQEGASPVSVTEPERRESTDEAAASGSLLDVPSLDDDMQQASPSSQITSPSKTVKRNRCHVCRKKVGLTGFQCRCGDLFCGLHRYADKHNCTFDYKAAGRKELEVNNPKVVAAKVQRI